MTAENKGRPVLHDIHHESNSALIYRGQED
jgi:hypothetical protein